MREWSWVAAATDQSARIAAVQVPPGWPLVPPPST